MTEKKLNRKVAWEIVKDLQKEFPDIWTKEELNKCKKICKNITDPMICYETLRHYSKAFKNAWEKHVMNTLPDALRIPLSPDKEKEV